MQDELTEKRQFKKALWELNEVIFYTSFLCYFSFLLLESIRPGFVSNFFSLRFLLMITFISGTIFFGMHKKND